MKVAHLTPHLGGGVGTVIESFFEYLLSSNVNGDVHTVFCLEQLKRLPMGIPAGLVIESMADRELDLSEQLSTFDVILCHYWNHPLLASLLGRGRLPEARVLFWCHNSGLEEPHIIPDYILNSGALVVFSTPVSAEARNIREKCNLRPNDFSITASTRSLSKHFVIGHSRQKKAVHTNLLYVGTVSRSKLHADSAEIFSLLSKCGFNIDVVGGNQEQSFEAQVRQSGGKVMVHGWVEEPLCFYSSSDIFVYPLRSGHYGTGEQVILEAMASGLPVIVFNNPAENAIVVHGETGFVANTKEEFIFYVNMLSRDRALYFRMRRQGIARAKESFDSIAMAESLLGNLHAQLARPKLSVSGPSINRSSDIGLRLFCMHSFFEPRLESELDARSDYFAQILFRRILSDLESPERRGAWISTTKGSPFHYLNHFPESIGLTCLCDFIRGHISALEKEAL